MKVLLSAYACAPGHGSEPEVGLQVLDAALQEHEVWVLTQPHMVGRLRPWLATHPFGTRAHLLSVDPPAPDRQDGLGALVRTQISHERWQRAAAVVARDLHAQVGFDLVHHATLAAYWMRTAVADLGLPLVWGPVGGAVEPPLGLVPELGLRGAVEDAVRAAVRLAFWRRPVVRRAARAADVVLVQNAATRRRLSAHRSDVRVLPNALCARVETMPEGTRRNDVAVVGRVVAWKAVTLAVRVLAALPDREVVLRVYGEAGPAQARRVQRVAARLGVQERVVLVGRLAREELLGRVATSGLLLHPSLHDEASFTVAEALAVGTPVVALDHGGPPHVAAQWPLGATLMVRPSTPGRTARRLAEAVSTLLDPARPLPAQTATAATDFGDAVRDSYASAVSRAAARRA